MSLLDLLSDFVSILENTMPSRVGQCKGDQCAPGVFGKAIFADQLERLYHADSKEWHITVIETRAKKISRQAVSQLLA